MRVAQPRQSAQPGWSLRGPFVVLVLAVLLGALIFSAVRRSPPAESAGAPEAEALRAITAGDTRKLRAEAGRLNLNLHGAALICNAASAGQARAIQTLVELGVDPNVALPSGQTPLMSAALVGRTNAVKCLLDAGADPHRQLWSGDTALTLAERGGHEETAAVLRKRVETGAR